MRQQRNFDYDSLTLKEVGAALYEVALKTNSSTQPHPFLTRLSLLLRYTQYDRFPSETNIFTADVYVRKEKTGGMPRTTPTPLPIPAEKELEEIVLFLNAHLKQWEWRSIRNLLRGSRLMPDVTNIRILYQRELAVCGELFSAGDLGAGLVAADFCRSANDIQEAINWLTQTNELAEKNNDMVGQANCQLMFGDWLSAPYSTPVVWNFAMESSSSQGGALPTTVESIEFSPPTPENMAQARQAYENAQQLFAQANNQLGLGQVQLRFGYLSMLAEDFVSTADFVEQAAKSFQENGDPSNARLAETHRLMALVAENRIPEAQDLAKSIGDWCLESGNFSWTVGLGLLVGRFARHLMLRKGKAELAIKAYRIARQLQSAIGANYHAAQYLTDIGEVYKATGQHEAAIVHFEQAVDEMGLVLDKEWAGFKDELNTVIHTRTNMVMFMSDIFQLGMRRQDADLMDKSLARMQAACDKLRMEANEQHEKTMPQIGQVIGLCDQMAEQSLVLSPLYQAKQLRDLGDLAGFEKHWQRSVEALEKISPEQKAVLGTSVWGMKRDWEKAAESFKDYIGLGGNNSGFVGELVESIQKFGEQGKGELQLHQYNFHTLAFSGLVRTKQFAEALTHFEALGKTFGEEWWLREQAPWLSLSDTGEMMEGLGRFEEALRLFDTGFVLLEERRSQLSQDELKVALNSSQNTQYLYAYAARTALSAKQPERSFNYTEQGKARGLLDLMEQNSTFGNDVEGSISLHFKLREIDAHRSSLMGQLAKERSQNNPDAQKAQQTLGQLDEAEIQRQAIEQAFSKQAKVEEKATSIDTPIAIVSKALPKDTLLVEYLLTSEQLLIWAVQSAGIAFAQAYAIADWEVKSEISQLRKAIMARQEWQALASQLSNRLLEPISGLVRRFPKIIIVPHGALHTLPFQVLPLDGKPLGLQKSLSYMPSASAMRFLEKAAIRPNAQILSVGNPTGDLNAAAVEALFVAKQFGGEENALVGYAATEMAVKEQLPKAELLHFATHGQISEESPMHSALSLANGESLTLQELTGIQLRAELVVLSACDTGRGTHTGGDDVLGLTRGLIAGGAKSAVVSLWQVNDVSTALLMGHFYQQLRKGVAAPEALGLAQLYLSNLSSQLAAEELKKLELGLDDSAARDLVSKERSGRGISGFEEVEAEGEVGYEHPYFWAAFVFVGW